MKKQYLNDIVQKKDFGVTVNKMFIHPFYNTKEARQYCADLIYDYNYEEYAQLTIDDKCKFSAILLVGGEKLDDEVIVENKELPHLLVHIGKLLLNEGDLTAFNDDLKKAVVDYYDGLMNKIFTDVYTDWVLSQDEWYQWSAKQTDPDRAFSIYRESL